MDLTLTADFATQLPAFMALEAEASRAYNLFAYRDSEQADEIRRLLFENRRGEFSPPNGQALLDGGRMVGILVCLPGKALSACRLRMALEMKKAGFFEQDPQLSHRLQLAGQIFLKPERRDFYLSRLAVASDLRGQGLGGVLLEEFERRGAEAECNRFVFEVSAENTAAIEFYRRYGYREVDRRKVLDPDSGCSIEYLHMATRQPAAAHRGQRGHKRLVMTTSEQGSTPERRIQEPPSAATVLQRGSSD